MLALTIEWDEKNRSHFAERGRCSEVEVEQVLLSTCHDSRRRRQANGRFRYAGQTCSGRYLTVIAVQKSITTLRPVTCIPLAGRALTSYLAWRSTTKSR
jgi:hypothetical protein